MSTGTWGLDVSAGELLGRTHEELVLLLIQLRRQSAGVCKAMETCHIEIEAQVRFILIRVEWSELTKVTHDRSCRRLTGNPSVTS